MTAKRFTVPKNYRCIQDNLTKEHYLCEDKTEAINLAYLLNELSEENEQLKYSLSAYMVDLNNYKGKCSALEQENESLKEENKFLRNKIKTYKSGNALLKKTLDKEWK